MRSGLIAGWPLPPSMYNTTQSAAVEELLVLRPAVAGHDRPHAVGLLQKVHQDRGAGEELVVARAVALAARDEQDFCP